MQVKPAFVLTEEVKAWKVIRVAGLKENFSDRVRAALESTLYTGLQN